MQNQLRILELAFYYRRQFSDIEIKAQLTEKIKLVRNYISAAKNGAYDHQNSWDCGRQDAFGDKVDKLFRDFEALKISYDLNGRSTKRLNRLTKQIINRG